MCQHLYYILNLFFYYVSLLFKYYHFYCSISYHYTYFLTFSLLFCLRPIPFFFLKKYSLVHYFQHFEWYYHKIFLANNRKHNELIIFWYSMFCKTGFCLRSCSTLQKYVVLNISIIIFDWRKAKNFTILVSNLEIKEERLIKQHLVFNNCRLSLLWVMGYKHMRPSIYLSCIILFENWLQCTWTFYCFQNFPFFIPNLCKWGWKKASFPMLINPKE